MSWLRLLALAAIACLASFVAGNVMGASGERERQAAAQAQSNLERSEANNVVTIDAGRASSDFGDLQLRTRTEAADGRREIERQVAPPARGAVGASAMVDAHLAELVLCRVERLRGYPARTECDAANRVAGEPARAVSPRPVAGSR